MYHSRLIRLIITPEVQVTPVAVLSRIQSLELALSFESIDWPHLIVTGHHRIPVVHLGIILAFVKGLAGRAPPDPRRVRLEALFVSFRLGFPLIEDLAGVAPPDPRRVRLEALFVSFRLGFPFIEDFAGLAPPDPRRARLEALFVRLGFPLIEDLAGLAPPDPRRARLEALFVRLGFPFIEDLAGLALPDPRRARLEAFFVRRDCWGHRGGSCSGYRSQDSDGRENRKMHFEKSVENPKR